MDDSFSFFGVELFLYELSSVIFCKSVKYSTLYMYSFNFLKQLSEWRTLGKCSPCVAELEEDYMRGQTRRDADHEACCSNTCFQGRRCRDPQCRHIHTMMHSSDHSVQQQCVVISMSADTVEADCHLKAEDSSSVSELSFSLQSLQCQDG